jgi:hypothetical protein
MAHAPTPRLVPLTRTLLGLALQLERDAATAKLSNLLSHAKIVLQPGLGVAAIDGGVLVGAGGLAPVWRGRAEAWLLVSRIAERRSVVAALRLARDWLDAMQREPPFRRVEIFVRWKEPWRESFAAALGFALEGRLARWGADGEDHAIYARIAKGEA